MKRTRLFCVLLAAAMLLSLAACTSPLEEKLWEILTPHALCRATSTRSTSASSTRTTST